MYANDPQIIDHFKEAISGVEPQLCEDVIENFHTTTVTPKELFKILRLESFYFQFQ